MSNRIGMFGGTFDPIHWGHLFIAQYFADVCELDKVLFIPAYISPLKYDSYPHSTAIEDRVEMLEMAIEDNPKFVLEDFEILRKDISYTIDTIDYLREKYIGKDLYLLVGEDNANVFNEWSMPEAILEKTNVVVYKRGGIAKVTVPENKVYLNRMEFLDAPLIPISASDIRARCSAGKSLKYWVPEKVKDYIEIKNLYK